jgi:hypothetical protein
LAHTAGNLEISARPRRRGATGDGSR